MREKMRLLKWGFIFMGVATTPACRRRGLWLGTRTTTRLARPTTVRWAGSLRDHHQHRAAFFEGGAGVSVGHAVLTRLREGQELPARRCLLAAFSHRHRRCKHGLLGKESIHGAPTRTLARRGTTAALTALRVGVGVILVAHGLQKLLDTAGTARPFRAWASDAEISVFLAIAGELSAVSACCWFSHADRRARSDHRDVGRNLRRPPG
jgi:hypothetical protein